MDLLHGFRFHSHVVDSNKAGRTWFWISFQAGGAHLQGRVNLLHCRVSFALLVDEPPLNNPTSQIPVKCSGNGQKNLVLS